MVERALEANPDWVYNDLAPWNYHALPSALGCRGWFTAKVTTLGELDAALARAATGESASYIEVVGGRLDFPAGLAMAHGASMPCTGMARRRTFATDPSPGEGDEDPGRVVPARLRWYAAAVEIGQLPSGS